MSLKYAVLLKLMRLVNMKRIMRQPYEKTMAAFGTEKAAPKIPRLSDAELDFEVFQIGEQPVLWVKHKKPSEAVCLYLAGGGMLKYPKPSQAKEMITLAKRLNRDMILPYYPLCPKNTLTEVYEMLYALYKRLLQTYSAEKIVFLGGSSGGNLALGLISHINSMGEKLSMPDKVYVSSPGTLYASEEERNAALKIDGRDVIMSVAATEEIWKGMTGGREVPDYMKFLQLGNYTGLSDVYLSFGGDEVFSALADSIKNRLEEYGVRVTLEIGKGMYHCYAVMPLVREARQGYDEMIGYLKNP